MWLIFNWQVNCNEFSLHMRHNVTYSKDVEFASHEILSVLMFLRWVQIHIELLLNAIIIFYQQSQWAEISINTCFILLTANNLLLMRLCWKKTRLSMQTSCALCVFVCQKPHEAYYSHMLQINCIIQSNISKSFSSLVSEIFQFFHLISVNDTYQLWKHLSIIERSDCRYSYLNFHVESIPVFCQF